MSSKEEILQKQLSDTIEKYELQIRKLNRVIIDLESRLETLQKEAWRKDPIKMSFDNMVLARALDISCTDINKKIECIKIAQQELNDAAFTPWIPKFKGGQNDN